MKSLCCANESASIKNLTLLILLPFSVPLQFPQNGGQFYKIITAGSLLETKD